MTKLTHSSLATIAIFVIPIIITFIYRFIDISIGPVVLIYSIIGGVLIGVAWATTLWNKWNGIVGIMVGVPLGLVSIILLVNFFIWVTYLLGEQDYHLM